MRVRNRRGVYNSGSGKGRGTIQSCSTPAAAHEDPDPGRLCKQDPARSPERRALLLGDNSEVFREGDRLAADDPFEQTARGTCWEYLAGRV